MNPHGSQPVFGKYCYVGYSRLGWEVMMTMVMMTSVVVVIIIIANITLVTCYAPGSDLRPLCIKRILKTSLPLCYLSFPYLCNFIIVYHVQP